MSLIRSFTIMNSINVQQEKKIKQCARLSKYIYNVPSEVLINETKNALIITIEGTDTFSNWIDNFSIGLKKNDIHKGFFRYSTYCIRKYNLINVIKKKQKTIVHLWTFSRSRSGHCYFI